MNTSPPPYWVVSAEMGYGHQRAVHPFVHRANGNIIDAATAPTVDASERRRWKQYLSLYETLSRAKGMPVVGKQLFGLLDKLLHIPAAYPMRNLSRSTFQVDMLQREIGRGLGNGVLSLITSEWLPLLTSFYVPAIAADIKGYEPIYTIICDADLNRVWVAKEPWESRINYFAPCGKAAQRLKQYGVPEERIFLTGFPLHDDLLGGRDLPFLKHDLGVRLQMLDPLGRFRATMGKSVEHFLGAAAYTPPPADRVLTITYAVGGAGAQREIGAKLMQSFRQPLIDGTMQLNLVAGIRDDVRQYFEEQRRAIVGDSGRVHIVHAPSLAEYFDAFNAVIRSTDVLWTKPSELSFYTGLGLPIVMAPTIGSQEKFNRKWLSEVGSAMRQEKPLYASEWFVELLKNGRFADMAWLGFLRARKLGTYHVQDVIDHGQFLRSDDPLHR